MRESRTYIGVKKLKATPMTRGEFADFKQQPYEGESSDEGYLVEYADGYKSWSPKDTFDAAYLEVQDDRTLGIVAAQSMVHDVQAAKVNDNAVTVQVMTRCGAVFHETAYTDTSPANEDQWNLLSEAAMQRCLVKVAEHLLFIQKWANNGLGGTFELAPEKKLLLNTDLAEAAGGPIKLVTP